MHNWAYGESESWGFAHLNLALFVGAAVAAILVFLVFSPQIDKLNAESPILINIMFLPAMAIGFLYGIRIAERAVQPSEIRSPVRRSIVKIFLFFFVIGGMFSSVNFALNGGSIMPEVSILEDGLIPWAENFVRANGGATFLILTSIALMAAATKRIVGMDQGMLNKVVTTVGTFVFFSMLALSFTKSDPTSSSVFLYTFYHAGIIGGVLFAMNRLTRNLNTWEDFENGYR